MKIAVYGTLREGYGNHRLIRDCKKIGTGKTVNKYKMTAGNIPYVSDKEALDNIIVEVYEVPEGETLRRVDALEGHPGWYQRKPCPVQIEDKVVDTELYFMDNDNAPYVKGGDFTSHRKPIF